VKPRRRPSSVDVLQLRKEERKGRLKPHGLAVHHGNIVCSEIGRKKPSWKEGEECDHMATESGSPNEEVGRLLSWPGPISSWSSAREGKGGGKKKVKGRNW